MDLILGLIGVYTTIKTVISICRDMTKVQKAWEDYHKWRSVPLLRALGTMPPSDQDLLLQSYIETSITDL